MQWLWITLGIVLVAVVAMVLYSFFVVRPRSIGQLKASAELLARETHGRQPLVMGPAKCSAISAPDKEPLLGVGVLALTEQGVIFAAANPDRTLIVPREAVTAANGATQDGASAGSGATLNLAWRNAAGHDVQADFTVADAAPFVSELRP